jgi:hypothetical protein
MAGSNGAAVPDGCKNGGQSLLNFVGTTAYIPIVTGFSNGNYVIDGLAAFYVAGYRAPGTQQPNSFDGYSQGLTVSSPDVGFWGWFTAPILPIGPPVGTGTPRGPRVIALLG